MAIMTDQEMNRADLLATHEMLKRWNEDYPTYSEEEDDENTLQYQIENVLEIKILAELSLVNVDSWIMKGAELLSYYPCRGSVLFRLHRDKRSVVGFSRCGYVPRSRQHKTLPHRASRQLAHRRNRGTTSLTN